MDMISQGAEAKIYADNDKIIKDRFSKNYRYEDIDKALRQFRTRRETKVLKKLEELNFPAPRVLESDDKAMRITMSKISGDPVKNILNAGLARDIGMGVGKLHTNNIIHNDLTTSNMIMNNCVNFIDFGLSFFSEKTEDKAVDLHLFEQALESRHSEIFEDCLDKFYIGYTESFSDSEEVLDRLEQVKTRGRYKRKKK